MIPRWLMLPSTLLCACVAPAERSTPDVGEGAPIAVTLSIPEELLQCHAPDGEEPVGEACQPITSCEALCIVGAYLGCAGAWAACGAGDIVTVGALSLPCTPLIGVACTASSVGAAACISKECP